jgi:multiple sugar transport system substrate-binding protein
MVAGEASRRGPRRGAAAGGVRRRGVLMGLGGVVAAGGAVVLAACGAAPESGGTAPAASAPAGEVSVVYATFTEPALTRMTRQEADVTRVLPAVRLSMIPTNDPVAKLTTMSAGGTPPDVVWAGIEVAQHAAAGLIVALDELIAKDRSFAAKDFFPQALEAYQYKGKTWGIPYGLTTHVIAYNKAMLDKNGLKPPTKEWTIADFVANAKRMASPQGSDPQTQVWGAWITHLYTAIWMHGGQVYDKGFTKSVMDQPNAVNGLQFYYDQGFGAQKFAPTSNLSHRAGLNPTFGDGRLGMSSMPPATIPVLRERYPGLEWDVMTVPWNANKTRGTWLSGEAFSLVSGAKNRDGAWAVLKQLTGKDAQTNFYVPEVASVPSIRSVAEGPFVNAVPGKNARAFVESIEHATLWGGHPVILKTDVPVMEAWTEVREGRKSVRDGAAEATLKLNELLRTAGA